MPQSRRLRTLLVRIVLLFFALNFISLTIYFVHSRFCLTGETQIQSQTLPLPLSTLKPWPSLPSFLPWNSNPNLSHESCEAYFGNGFSQQVSRFGEGGNSGWFRCFYSATLKSSVCEGGRVRMDPRKIKMSKGGESLELVMGRREEEELPIFEDGAFEIEGSEGKVIGDRCVVDDEFLDHYVPWNAIQFHAMRGLMKSMRIVGSGQLQCSQWIEEPTVLVTRFEYANLFHTVTDWYNAYVSSRVTSLPNRPHLIYIDGHCKAPMEETWEALFTSATYAKNFSGSVCFRHAIFSPLGYENAIFKGLSESFNCQGTDASNLRENPDKHKTSRLSEFGEMLRAAFDLPMDDILISTASIHNILFVRREDYLAHPRHNGKVDSRLSNEQELFDSLRSWAANQTKCMFNVVNGRFAHMSMKEQINYMHKASIVIGAHGAGLSHLISARSKAIVLEITSTQYHRPHFPLISKLKGLEYHAIKLPGSYANPEAFIDELSNIVRRGLGC